MNALASFDSPAPTACRRRALPRAPRVDSAARGDWRDAAVFKFPGTGMSLPSHGTLPTLWSRNQVGGRENWALNKTHGVLQIRQPTSLKVGRVAMAQTLARCVLLPLGDIFRNIVAVRRISVRLGNGWKRLGRSER
jgi:hypothetical protein